MKLNFVKDKQLLKCIKQSFYRELISGFNFKERCKDLEENLGEK